MLSLFPFPSSGERERVTLSEESAYEYSLLRGKEKQKKEDIILPFPCAKASSLSCYILNIPSLIETTCKCKLGSLSQSPLPISFIALLETHSLMRKFIYLLLPPRHSRRIHSQCRWRGPLRRRREDVRPVGHVADPPAAARRVVILSAGP